MPELTITTAQAKQHLKIRENQNDEDTLIDLYIGAAIKKICHFLNVAEVPDEADIRAAALLIIGDLYQNRESMSEKELKPNKTVDSLLWPHRVDLGM